MPPSIHNKAEEAYHLEEGSPVKGPKHPIDADDALKALNEYADGSIELDPETERRILRKIDMNLMPVMLDALSDQFTKG